MRWLLIVPVLMITASLNAAPLKVPDSPALRPTLKSIYSTRHEMGFFFKKNTKAVAFVFLSPECPVARSYIPVLKEIQEEFADEHVTLLGIYSDAHVHVQMMAEHAHDADISFPVLLDVDHRLADLLEVESVPEVVVIDRNLEKKYQGAIDNQYKRRGQLQEATEHYLVDALRSVINDRPVAQPKTSVSGCLIEYSKPQRTKRDLTFYRDIAPLVQNNCQSCHRAGGIAPFELQSYSDVAYNAEKIQEAVSDRRMPPWHGNLNPEFGTLVNDLRLTEDQINTLLDWYAQGAPEGNSKDAPAARTWPRPDDWGIGKPDYVFKIPPFRVPKSGVLEYQFFRVKMNFDQDRWFNAVEVKPGNAEVVHHVGLHIVPAGNKTFTGFSGMAQLYGFNGESSRLINDYLPGDSYNAKVYPSEQAVRIPKHSDLIFEVHYTPNNRSEVMDQSMVGFRWASQPPQEELFTKVFRKPVGRFRIPPGVHHYAMEDRFYFDDDVVIDAVRPHFHLRGKSFRLEIVRRDEQTDEVIKATTVISVPIWDPGWQRTYELSTPLFLPAGTELRVVGHFDNSDLNPNNPNPSKVVEWGQQTTDEMFSTRFKYRSAKQAHEVVTPTAEISARQTR